MIDLRHEYDQGDLAHWEWLGKVLDMLGPDGMSSDESDVDDLGHKFCAHDMRWRNGQLTDYFKIIDDLKRAQTRGAKKTSRHYNNRTSMRGHVDLLPRALYDKDWLASREHHPSTTPLHISSEQFPFIQLTCSNDEELVDAMMTLPD